jgi:hypothetical protein
MELFESFAVALLLLLAADEPKLHTIKASSRVATEQIAIVLCFIQILSVQGLSSDLVSAKGTHS